MRGGGGRVVWGFLFCLVVRCPSVLGLSPKHWGEQGEGSRAFRKLFTSAGETASGSAGGSDNR